MRCRAIAADGVGGLCTVTAVRPTRKRGLVGVNVLHRANRNISFDWSKVGWHQVDNVTISLLTIGTVWR
jgi:hypothetical protein